MYCARPWGRARAVRSWVNRLLGAMPQKAECLLPYGAGGEHGVGVGDRAGSGGRWCDGSGGAGRRPKGIRTRVPVCRSIHQKAATQAGLRGRRLLISIVDKEAVSEARAQTKKGPEFAGPLLSLGCHLLQQRHQQQRDDVDDLDQCLRRPLTPIPSTALRERGGGAERVSLRCQRW